FHGHCSTLVCSKACSKCRLYDANKSLFSFAIRNLLIKNQGVGVDDGTRTHDDRIHNPGLYQLSYVHQISIFRAPGLHPGVARPAGLEPATLGLAYHLCFRSLRLAEFVVWTISSPSQVPHV